MAENWESALGMRSMRRVLICTPIIVGAAAGALYKPFLRCIGHDYSPITGEPSLMMDWPWWGIGLVAWLFAFLVLAWALAASRRDAERKPASGS